MNEGVCGQDIWCDVIQVRYVTRILFAFLFGLVKSHVDGTNIWSQEAGVDGRGLQNLVGKGTQKLPTLTCRNVLMNHHKHTQN
jgi:hypothetical protein